MISRQSLTRFVYVIFLGLLLFWSTAAYAQAQTATVSGQVTDPSGAGIGKAAVRAIPATGNPIIVRTNADGFYELKDLAPGTYTIRAGIKGFAPFEQQAVTLAAGQNLKLNISLVIATQEEKVEVQDSSTQLDVSASSNASSVVLKGEDLEALSDDPDDLQAELTALAGPSAGPNGGQIYIDGFTGGQLPPKSSIREIRINQNPFSAEYDKLGYGRIEIFTKPGTDKFHGQFMINGNSSAFNSRNPYLGDASQPAYDSVLYSGNIGGPINKNGSFFFNIDRRNIDEIAIINTPILDPDFNIVQFTGAVPNPRTRTNLGPRLDYQFGPNNTLTARYQYYRENETNNGIGTFSLPTQGYNALNTEQTLQISDTQVLSPTTINETRFQFQRENNFQNPVSTDPAVSVSGAFTGGGNSQGIISDIEDHYELQNYTSKTIGKHFVKFGGRYRATRILSQQQSGFNGSFNFNSILAYQITEQGIANGLTPEEIRAAGGGASKFVLVSGQPLSANTYVDAGLYAQDEWRARSNVTISYGLRFETQNQTDIKGSFAPRIGIAWGLDPGPKNQPKTVLRVGSGIFYDRFTQTLLLQAQRLNGFTQEQFIVTNPDFFPNVPLPTDPELTGAVTSPTTYQIDPNLKRTYTIQSGVTVERQLTKDANVAVTYLNSRGVHTLITRNINAPLPPDYNIDNRPLGGTDNIYQYEGAGIFKQNQLIVNSSVRVGTKLSLFGYYTLNYANSNTSGASGYPSNQYNLNQDYGRAAFDVRHRVFFGGTVSMPYAFRLSPFMIASSGSPFNFTLGQDLNNDSFFNDRPTYSELQSALEGVQLANDVSVHCAAAEDAIVPINCGTGPAHFSLNLRLSKTFGFGAKKEGAAQARGQGGGGGGGAVFGRGGGGPQGGRGGRGPGGDPSSGQKYSLTLGIAARNIFNNVNAGNPVGVLSSPIFGQINSLAGGGFGSSAANRRVDLQLTFSF